eukprot:2553213-Karenia_brevis.AAC.1
MPVVVKTIADTEMKLEALQSEMQVVAEKAAAESAKKTDLHQTTLVSMLAQIVKMNVVIEKT